MLGGHHFKRVTSNQRGGPYVLLSAQCHIISISCQRNVWELIELSFTWKHWSFFGKSDPLLRKMVAFCCWSFFSWGRYNNNLIHVDFIILSWVLVCSNHASVLVLSNPSFWQAGTRNKGFGLIRYALEWCLCGYWN